MGQTTNLNWCRISEPSTVSPVNSTTKCWWHCALFMFAAPRLHWDRMVQQPWEPHDKHTSFSHHLFGIAFRKINMLNQTKNPIVGFKMLMFFGMYCMILDLNYLCLPLIDQLQRAGNFRVFFLFAKSWEVFKTSGFFRDKIGFLIVGQDIERPTFTMDNNPAPVIYTHNMIYTYFSFYPVILRILRFQIVSHLVGKYIIPAPISEGGHG